MKEIDEREIRQLAGSLDKDMLITIIIKLMSLGESNLNEFLEFTKKQTPVVRDFIMRLLFVKAVSK